MDYVEFMYIFDASDDLLKNYTSFFFRYSA